MRASLLVNPVGGDWRANLDEAVAMISAAAAGGSSLVLLGEMAITGMVNNDDPQHDLPIGETIPGAISSRLIDTASKCGIWVGFGILEREESRLYDTALLVSPDGEIRLKYRRVHPQWHGSDADPAVYRQGTELLSAQTDFGSAAFMICGDITDDGLRSRIRTMKPDFVLHPFARSSPDGSRDQDRWDKEELPWYNGLLAELRVPVLGASYLCIEPFSPEADTYGGAMVFGRDGKLRASLPLNRVGVLNYDLGEPEATPK